MSKNRHNVGQITSKLTEVEVVQLSGGRPSGNYKMCEILLHFNLNPYLVNYSDIQRLMGIFDHPIIGFLEGLKSEKLRAAL